MLIINNEKERQILNMALKQRQVNVITSDPSYNAYNSIRQYKPDILLIELPSRCQDQLHLVKLLRKNKDTKALPIWGYGWQRDSGILNGIKKDGVNHYYTRPLKFSKMLTRISKVAKDNNKELQLAKESQKSDKERDMELLVASDTSATRKIDIMSGYISNLLAFPFTVARVMKLAEDQDAGAKDLAKVIQADPVISADLLKVSNTVFFAGRNQRINSLRDAVVRIGFRETKRIVTAMSVMKLVNQESRNLGFDRVDFWYHCLASGIIAEKLAAHSEQLSSEEAFLAGLLHDFGIIVMDEFFPSIFSKVYTDATQKSMRFIDAEEQYLRVTHDQVMADVFDKWKFPEKILQGVTEKYDAPSLSEEEAKSPGNLMKVCVYVSDLLAKSSCIGAECDQIITETPNHLLSAIRRKNGIPPQFLDDVYNEVGMYRKFLGLEERVFPQRELDDSISEQMQLGFVNLAGDLFVGPRFFLDKEQVQYQNIFATSETKSLDKTLDGIILWPGGDAAKEAIAAFTALSARPNDAVGSNGDGKLPVFAFMSASQKEQLGGEAASNCTVLSQVYDTRSLERIITEKLVTAHK